MNRKRKRVEDEEGKEHDDDMGSTASQSSEESTSSTEESDFDDDEETERSLEFKTILKTLSRAVPRQNALDLLHSMAASKSILFWTPKGEMLYKNRRIPVTNMAELCEYILLPYNVEVPKPRALNTFLNGIAEIGIDKKLVRNKKILADLIVRENEIQSGDESEEGESDSETSSQGSEQSQASETEQAEENEKDDRGSDNDNSADGEAKEYFCQNCDSPDLCHMVVITCPKCKWKEGFVTPQSNLKCIICDGTFGLNRNCLRDLFQLCNVCGFLTHTNIKTGRKQHFEPETESGIRSESDNE